MIYDCIIYNGEKDLLYIRLSETCLCDDWVTTIIIEANKTHTGLDKPLYFEQHKDEFKMFNIMYLAATDMPDNCTAKEREIYQRNKIKDVLEFLSPKEDDIVIISDVDEVPRARQIKLFKPDIYFAALIMDKYNYYVNLLEGYQIWNRGKIMSWRYLKDKQPNDVRDSGYDFALLHAGFHFSWLGGADKAVEKLKSFSHTELDTPENEEKVRKAENIWDDTKFKKVEVDLSFPEYLYRNQEKYKHLIA